MGITAPSRQELTTMIESALTERAGITNFSESSVAGTLSSVMGSFMSNIYSAMAESENNNNLSTAYGPYLGRIGDLYGVSRLRSTAATTVGSGRSVMFTNPTGNEYVVPVHTRVWANNNYNINYYTDNEVRVPPTTSGGISGRAYVDVSAANTGEGFNVAPNTLTNHNFGSQLLQVTNVRSISNGSDLEGDDNYRFRIKNAILSRQGDSQTTLVMRLLELPGIRNVDVRPLARGTGTVDVVIVPMDRYVTDTLLESAQIAAEESVSLGISVKVKPPIEHPVDIEVQLAVNSASDKTTAKSLVASAIRSAIDNLPMGNADGEGDLIISDLVASGKNSAIGIRDINISKLLIDNRPANLVNQIAPPGERYFLQSIKVV